MKRQLLLVLVLIVVGVVGAVGAQQDDPERETPLVCDKFTDSPENERVTYYMGEGVAYYVSGQLSRANDSFSCIVEQIDGSYAPAYTSRAVVYTEQRDYDEAIEDYGSAIGLDGSLIGAYNNRGIAFAAMREYDDALADFNRALDIDGSYQFALVNRGVINAVTGEFEAAIADLEQAISLSGIDDVVADLTRPDRRGDDPFPQYDVDDAHVYAILGIVYSGFALDNYEDYLLLTGYLYDTATGMSEYFARTEPWQSLSFEWQPFGDKLYYFPSWTEHNYVYDPATGEHSAIEHYPSGIWSRDGRYRFDTYYLPTDDLEDRQEAGLPIPTMKLWDSETGLTRLYCAPSQWRDSITVEWSPDHRYVALLAAQPGDQSELTRQYNTVYVVDTVTGVVVDMQADMNSMFVWMEEAR